MDSRDGGDELGRNRERILTATSLVRFDHEGLVFCMPEIVGPKAMARLMPKLKQQFEFRGRMISSRCIWLQMHPNWKESALAVYEHTLATRLGVCIYYDGSGGLVPYSEVLSRAWPPAR